MKFKASLAAMIVAATGLSTATAQDKAPADVTDPVSLRMHVMANVGKATGIGGRMLKGEIDYNPQAGRAVFLTMNAAALGFFRLFPQDSTSPESEAADAIWTDRQGFRDAVAKFIADTGTAAAAPVNNIDQFREQFGMVTQNCKACHEDYRVKKN